MSSRFHGTAPDLDAIEALAREALGAIPEKLRRQVADVVIQVREFPDDDTLDEMGCESEFDLLGLYRGVPMDRKSTADAPQDVDMIFLYRRAILDYWCDSGEDLAYVIRHVLVHEIGHHFGFSDADMERIEAQA